MLIFLTFWLVICKLMRIRIQLITLIRIQLTTLMRIRIQILPFNLMRIRNHNTADPDSTFTLILIRIQFSIKMKKESATFGLQALPGSMMSRQCSIAIIRSSRIFTLMRIRIKLFTFCGCGSGFSHLCGSRPGFPKMTQIMQIRIRNTG
jgi:hypothetical protein